VIDRTPAEIITVAVIGAGTMGAQIAQQIALHRREVRLYDVDPSQLERALQSNRGHLQRRVAKGALRTDEAERAIAAIRPCSELAEAVAGVELVIEAVVEEVGVKREVFAQLDILAPARAILATNSSTMTTSEITADLPGRARALALHFFNPALVMRPVEIAPAPYTDAACVEAAARFVGAIDREPVVLHKEIAGLLVNRVLWALRREALWLADNGFAEPREIDRAIKLGLNHPMGPFALADHNGLDVVLMAQRHRFERSGDEAERPSPLLESLVEQGALGRKSGRGFYDYPPAAEAPER
jgi:3-hydroxybutyryl-CoA dehydrogenase